MRALNHKLVRELWQLRGQALAIALVIGAGLAAVLMSISTLDSLQSTRTIYYRDYAFAEVFASLKRAPDPLCERIAAIPGVNQINTRVWAPVTIEIAGFTDPISGLLVSAPRAGRADLNRLYLRAGRLMDPDRSDEIVIGDAFAEAHGFQPGDRLGVIIDGKRKQLRIVGSAQRRHVVRRRLPWMSLAMSWRLLKPPCNIPPERQLERHQNVLLCMHRSPVRCCDGCARVKAWSTRDRR